MCGSGLTLKLEKCEFAKPQVTFVGHIIGSGRHGHDPDKVACVVENMKTHTTKKEVRQVLGFFSYFRSYTRDFAETAKPLTELTKKGVPHQIQWTREHQRAFDKLKSDMADAIKLHIIHFGELSGILVDASSISVGCCLIQWAEDGLEKPISFTSAKLTPTQTC